MRNSGHLKKDTGHSAKTLELSCLRLTLREGETARILVIDDDKSIRKTLEAILKAEGYLVDTAEDGKEALEKMDTRYYNLALIDIKLPDMEGIELLTKLKDARTQQRFSGGLITSLNRMI